MSKVGFRLEGIRIKAAFHDGKIVPGMVGVDIGCGMETVKITERERVGLLRVPKGLEMRVEGNKASKEALRVQMNILVDADACPVNERFEAAFADLIDSREGKNP